MASRSLWIDGGQEVLLDPTEMGPRRVAQAVETLSREDGLRSTCIARAGPPLDEAVEHQSIDEAGHAALAEDHAVRELAHPDPPLRRVGDRE